MVVFDFVPEKLNTGLGINHMQPRSCGVAARDFFEPPINGKA
jgi:hypothetical protein